VARVSEDARFESAMAASSHERRNRPRSLILLGGLLLGASFLTALLGWWSRTSARAHYEERSNERFRLQRMVQEWRDLEAKQSAGTGTGAHDPYPNLLSTMENLATSAGIKTVPQPPRPSERQIPGGKETTYVYTDVRDESLQSLIDWVRLASEEIPGMELMEIPELKADGAGWRMRVIFKRWER
jgi:hypothetical protein